MSVSAENTKDDTGRVADVPSDGSSARSDEAATPSEAPFPRRSFYQTRMEWIVGGAAVAVFLAVWQVIGTSGLINPLYTSAPSEIARAFWEMVQNGTLAADIAVSGKEFVVGYALAVVIGIPVGVIVGWYRPANALLNPFIMSMYATPRVALMPLMIVWLGIGFWSVVAVVMIGAIFPLIINMQTAMRTLDRDLLKAARSFGASEGDIFRTIALPSSLPFLISGLRLGLGHALIGVVVGEMFGATAGIGYRITVAGATFQTAEVFVSVFLLVAAALIMNTTFLLLERRFGRWRG